VSTQHLPIARILRVSQRQCATNESTVMSTHYLFDNVLRYDQLPPFFIVQIDQSRVNTASVSLDRIVGAATASETLSSNSSNGYFTFVSSGSSCGIASPGVYRLNFTTDGVMMAQWLVTQFGAPERPTPSYQSVTQSNIVTVSGTIAPPRALAVFDVDGDGFDDLIAASEAPRQGAQYVQVCRSVEPPAMACTQLPMMFQTCADEVALWGNGTSQCLKEAIMGVCLASLAHCTGFANSTSTCRIRPPLPRRVLDCKRVAMSGADDMAFFHRRPTTYGGYLRGDKFGVGTLSPTQFNETNSTAVPDPLLQVGIVPSVLAYDANDDQMIDFNALSRSKRWIGLVGANVQFQNLSASGLTLPNRHSIGITRPPPLRLVSVVQREHFRVNSNGSLSSVGALDGIAFCLGADESLSHLWLDCDNDGDQDVVVACNKYLIVYESVGDTLRGRPPIAMGDNRRVVSATVGDLNRDGFMDIGGTVSQTNGSDKSGNLFAAYGAGECRFDLQFGNPVDKENNMFATMIDVDSDGDMDVAAVVGSGALVLVYATEPGSATKFRMINGSARALVSWPDTLRVRLIDVNDVRTPFLSHVELRDSATGVVVAAQQVSPSFGNLKPSTTLMFNTGDMVRWYTADGAPRRFVDIVVHFASDLIRNEPAEVPTIVTAAHWSDQLVTVTQSESKRDYMRPVLPALSSVSAPPGDVIAANPPVGAPVGHAAYRLSLVCVFAATNDAYPFAARAFRVRVVRSEPMNATTSFDVGSKRTPAADVFFADATVGDAANGIKVRLFSTASKIVLGVTPMFSINDDRTGQETSTGMIVFPLNAPTAPPTPPPTTRSATTSSASGSEIAAVTTTSTMSNDTSKDKTKDSLTRESKDNNTAIIISVSVVGGIVVLAVIVGMIVCYRAKLKYRDRAKGTKRRLERVDSGNVEIPTMATMKMPNTATHEYTTAPPLNNEQYSAAPPPKMMYGAAPGLMDYDSVPKETEELMRGDTPSARKRPKKRSDGYEIAPELDTEE
jgi:hypothetical protein